MPRTFVDDNYGTYEVDSEDDIEFYKDVQKRSVRKKCIHCRRWVKLLPEYECCDSCARKIEQGYDLG